MKKYTKSSQDEAYKDQRLFQYLFQYADGNGAASRGMEPDHLCSKIGYLPDDKFAYFAAVQINYLPEDFKPEDVLDEAEYYFGDLEEFEELSEEEALDMLENLDVTGGDPMIYKISKSGKPIYYDIGLEEYVLDLFSEDE